MSGAFSDPFPHAAAFAGASAPITFSVPARGLLLSNFAAASASITVQTVSGETDVIALGVTALTTPPIYLPIQAAGIQAAPNVGTITALWH